MTYWIYKKTPQLNKPTTQLFPEMSRCHDKTCQVLKVQAGQRMEESMDLMEVEPEDLREPNPKDPEDPRDQTPHPERKIFQVGLGFGGVDEVGRVSKFRRVHHLKNIMNYHET